MFVLCLLGMFPAFGAEEYGYRKESSQYIDTRSVETPRKATKTSRRTGNYSNTITNNVYYTQSVQPANNARVYRDEPRVVYEKPVKQKKSVVQTKQARTSTERKYFLAHPFFQPLKGRFGSVTDFSYAKNSFKANVLSGSFRDMDFDPTSGYMEYVPENGLIGLSGKVNLSQFLVKEDFSFGLSDTLSLMLMAQYDITRTKFTDWTGDYFNVSGRNSGLRVFGVGLQNRFIDTDKWIAMFSGFFQHQKDEANTLMFEGKAGYKVDRTTIYGLARLGYSNLTDGEAYGVRVDYAAGDILAFTYKQDVKDVIYAEAGAGVFSVLNKYTYLGGELVLGHYDWHNQVNIKGNIGIQPNEFFALNLYASTALYDSAKGKIKRYMMYDVYPDPVEDADHPGTYLTNPASSLAFIEGNYKMDSYKEWKIGVQAILYF